MALNTNGKKSSLKEDAYIYEKREDDITGKQRWRDLPKKAKRTQFKEYYLRPLLIVLLAIVVVGFFIYHDFIAKEDVIYQCDIVNETLLADSLENFSEDFVRFNNLDASKNNATFQTYFLDSALANSVGATVSTDMQHISAQLYAATVDSMITDDKVFQNYWKNGMYLNLNEFLTKEEKEALKDCFYIPEDKELNPEMQPYGIYLNESTTYQSMFIKDQVHRVEKPILTIVTNSTRQEISHTLLRYLFPDRFGKEATTKK